MKILVTSGATREAIDKVRFITNMSSGKTGAAIAESMHKFNHTVTYLHGEGAGVPSERVEKIKFQDFADLDRKMKELMELRRFEVVVHLAAVSDYSVDKVLRNGEEIDASAGKLPSEGSLEIKLKPNHKILSRIKDYVSDYEPLVIGFKLTHTEDERVQHEAIEKIFHEGSVDLIVHNDLREIEAKAEHNFHVYNIFEKLGTYSGPEALATKLNTLIKEVL